MFQKLLKSIDVACDILLEDKKIRYVCIIDKMGNLQFEKTKNKKSLLISDKKSLSLYMKSVLEISLQKDFDDQIGTLRYNISRRKKIDVITIPMFNYVILISVTSHENCDLIATNTIKIFEKILKKSNIR
jgi:hypothetical protein